MSLNPLEDHLSTLDDGANSEFDDDGRGRIVRVASSPRPYSSVESLMRCAPGDEPEPSQEELYPLREVIQDAIEGTLTEREQYIFDAVTVERVSIREIGQRLSLSKSQVHRIYKQACATLAAHLADHDTIKQHLSKENK